MFRRSYEIEYNQTEKKAFLLDVFATLKIAPYAIRTNKRAYDMFKDQKVKTLHYVVRYNPEEYFRERVERLRHHFLGQWFFLQENPVYEKSIVEVNHFHAVQVLSRLR